MELPLVSLCGLGGTSRAYRETGATPTSTGGSKGFKTGGAVQERRPGRVARLGADVENEAVSSETRAARQ
jgi:hypothetical protein